MSQCEIIAYSGQAFTIEWYYDQRGRSEALEYFELLSEERQDALLVLLKRMGDAGKIFDITKFRSEGDKIYAFKPQPDRFLCFFFAGRRIIITNAFAKKSQKLPSGEKERALKAKASYELRVKGKVYYESL
jgi:phage-related protein